MKRNIKTKHIWIERRAFSRLGYKTRKGGWSFQGTRPYVIREWYGLTPNFNNIITEWLWGDEK